MDEAEMMIASRTRKEVDLICLPELFISKINLINLDENAEEVSGVTFHRMSAIAKTNKTFIICGILEKSNGKYYNTALLIDDEGNLAGKHRKIGLNSFEKHFITRGEQAEAFETKLGRIGMVIGNDINSLGVCSILAAQDIDIMVYLTQVPFEFSEVIRTVALSRVMDMPMYLIISSIVGTSSISRIDFIGLTSILFSKNLSDDIVCCQPKDFVIDRLNGDNEGMLESKIDVEELKELKQDSAERIEHGLIDHILFRPDEGGISI